MSKGRFHDFDILSGSAFGFEGQLIENFLTFPGIIRSFQFEELDIDVIPGIQVFRVCFDCLP